MAEVKPKKKKNKFTNQYVMIPRFVMTEWIELNKCEIIKCLKLEKITNACRAILHGRKTKKMFNFYFVQVFHVRLFHNMIHSLRAISGFSLFCSFSLNAFIVFSLLFTFLLQNLLSPGEKYHWMMPNVEPKEQIKTNSKVAADLALPKSIGLYANYFSTFASTA